MVNRFKLFDRPNARKEHSVPTPTFGGISIFAGMMVALLFWFKFNNHPSTSLSFIHDAFIWRRNYG
jgi:UDP-N-acetylmuramyl pentapeptide phosphotransferase/UDP-N-acetylglucosamine-1-phosphate transferase